MRYQYTVKYSNDKGETRVYVTKKRAIRRARDLIEHKVWIDVDVVRRIQRIKL